MERDAGCSSFGVVISPVCWSRGPIQNGDGDENEEQPSLNELLLTSSVAQNSILDLMTYSVSGKPSSDLNRLPAHGVWSRGGGVGALARFGL